MVWRTSGRNMIARHYCIRQFEVGTKRLLDLKKSATYAKKYNIARRTQNWSANEKGVNIGKSTAGGLPMCQRFLRDIKQNVIFK